MIQTGDYIIYGSNGVCKVEAIGTVNKEGIPKDKYYYTLIPVYTRGNRIYTPVDNSKVVIRPVISKEEALSLIDSMVELKVLDISEDRRGEEVIKEVLGKCDCYETAKIFKSLYIKRQLKADQGKKQNIREDKYFNLTKENLIREMAITMGVDIQHIEDLLIKSVKKSFTQFSSAY